MDEGHELRSVRSDVREVSVVVRNPGSLFEAARSTQDGWGVGVDSSPFKLPQTDRLRAHAERCRQIRQSGRFRAREAWLARVCGVQVAIEQAAAEFVHPGSGGGVPGDDLRNVRRHVRWMSSVAHPCTNRLRATESSLVGTGTPQTEATSQFTRRMEA